MADRNDRSWLERNANGLFWALAAVCAAVVAAQIVVHVHGHFAWEEWFGFHAIYGFVVFVFVVFAGKALRKLVMRGEDYYDR